MKILNDISTSTERWPPLSGYDLIASFSSVEQSTCQIWIFPIWRGGHYMGPCQRPYWSPDGWHQWFFPCPPTQLHLQGRLLCWSGRTCPWWSHTGLFHTTSISSTFQTIASRRICSLMFPDTEVRLKDWYFPGFFFLPFLKMVWHCLFSSHQGFHLTAITFQISSRAAWWLHQIIPSGLWNASLVLSFQTKCLRSVWLAVISEDQGKK